jgi:NAD(P)-dependent dehydrogenase (short-subunit alcohol dehydrogenase family)
MPEARVAVVTGGTSGIGRAGALGLAAAGYRVAVCGRREAELAKVAADGGLALAEACDVTDPVAVAAFFAKVRERLGRVDVVFNNAGQFSGTTNFGDTEISTWQRMIEVNLNGAFYVAREAFRAMREQTPQGGRIINNGSISAHAPRPGAAPYTAAKHAITGLTKSIALDGRAFDIAASQIDIGNASTEMAQRMASGVPQANGTIAIEPLMDVAHVASAVLYIAGLPLTANVQFMTVMATKMPFVGRG